MPSSATRRAQYGWSAARGSPPPGSAPARAAVVGKAGAAVVHDGVPG
ncbi:hypothetical protein LT493_04935 [Streptomyces tricolor]|nr:hypothetical protein [Streptomyces tricolor]